MARARFYKTLFISGLYGQYKLWENDVVRIASKVDEIVQLGNIIGLTEAMKGNDHASANAALVDYLLKWRATYSNWVQLMGPHEIMALNYPDHFTTEATNRLLRKRWFESEGWDIFQTATVNKSRLVTHGGLTHGLWVNLGKPATAEEAAQLLNQRYNKTLYQGPCYRLTGKPNFAANPIFADPVRELYPSWATAPDSLPFDQVHGSGGLNSLEGREALLAPYSPLEGIEKVSHTHFGSVVSVAGGTITSVYPDVPREALVSHFTAPWTLYLEKMPLIDLREELFD